MPVSGYDEPGFKSLARHSSESLAGIPIKKRRFPLVLPQSPPSQTPSSQPVEPDLPYKEQSNLKTESSLNASGTKEVSGIAGTNRSSSLEEKGDSSADRNVNLVQSNVNHPGFNLQEPILTVVSGSGAEMGCEGKILLADRSASHTIRGDSELQFVPKESLGLQIGVAVYGKGKLGRDDRSELLNIAGNSELQLAPMEPLISALANQNSQGSCEKQELVDPHSLNLALAKGNNNVQSGSSESKSEIDGSHLCTSRSHWDLNTVMDTWEGSINDAAVAHDIAGVAGLDGDVIHDVKLAISSTEIVLRESEGTQTTSGKQILDENVSWSKFPSLFNPPDQHSKSEHLLHLCLNPSGCQSSFSQEYSCTSTTVDSKGVRPNLRLSELVSPASKLDLVCCGIAKSEPFDENDKQDLNGAKLNSVKLDCRILKSEPVDRYGEESLKSYDHGFVKAEPVCRDNRMILKTAEGIPNQLEISTCAEEVPISGDVLHNLEISTCGMEKNRTGQVSHPLELLTFTAGLPASGEVSKSLEYPPCTKGTPVDGDIAQEECKHFDRVTSDVVSESVDPDAKKPIVTDVTIASSKPGGLNVADAESSKLKSMGEFHQDSYNHGEVAESDEEKINISADMLEDDSYDTDYESDGDHAMRVTDTEDKQHSLEDDDYEDGEVREPLVGTANEGGLCEEVGAEHVDYGESDYRDAGISGFPGGDLVTTSSIGEDRGVKIEEPDESKNAPCSGECDNNSLNAKNDQDSSKVACLQESLVIETPSTGSGKKGPIKAAQRKPLNRSGTEDGLKGHETELTSNHALSTRQGTAAGDGKSDVVSQQEHVKGTNPMILPKVEAFVNSDEAVQDVNSRGTQSRIINLSRACNGSSSSNMRTIPDRFLPSQTERERFTDVVHRGDRLHFRGSREEGYMDGPRKFGRERSQDQPVGTSRPNFIHRRGKFDNRLDTLHGDWNSGCDYASEHCSGPTFPLHRPKTAAAVTAAKLECSGFVVDPDGTLSRRRPPGGREGPAAHGAQMVRRHSRDFSPDRCIGEGGPDLVRLRPREKFMRDLPDDMMDPIFSRSQPEYEGLDPFLRGDRSFSSIQRGPLHIPHVHSKSPHRSRTRSPGPWSSPGRSPNGFNGHPAMTHHRSPQIYRIDRMRSPDQRPCFTEDMVGRRHDSPPYMSRLPNDMREMGSAKEHDHPSSFMSHRSPSGRVLPRSNRRYDVIPVRERTESDEYFGGSMHSGRFHELGGDGGVDERRKSGERRGPVHSFRPPYNGTDVDNFRFNVEDGPRPYRFRPEADTEFHERRERDFDRRFKTRPGNVPRRIRSIEEQEENYRNGGQGWNDTGFDDVARMKRRRF